MGKDLFFFSCNCREWNYTHAPKIPTPLVCALHNIPAFEGQPSPCIGWMSVQWWGCRDELPWWLSGKESSCQCRRPGFHLWSREIPWRRKWQRTAVFLPGESHGQRSLAGYSPWGCKESDMTEHTVTYCGREGFLGMMILVNAGLGFPNEREESKSWLKAQHSEN